MFKSILQKGVQQGPKVFSRRNLMTSTGQPILLSLTNPSDHELTEKMLEGLKAYGKSDEVHRVAVADFLSRSNAEEVLKGNLSSKHSASQISSLLEMAEQKSVNVEPVPIVAANNHNEKTYIKALDQYRRDGVNEILFTGGSFRHEDLGMDISKMTVWAQYCGFGAMRTISALGSSPDEMKEYVENSGVDSFVSESTIESRQQIKKLQVATEGKGPHHRAPHAKQLEPFSCGRGSTARKLKLNEAEKRFEKQEGFLRDARSGKDFEFSEDGTLSPGARLPPNVVEMPSSLFNESGHVTLDAFKKQIRENIEMLKDANNVSHWIRGYGRTNVNDEFGLMTGHDIKA
ncbi:hypothetical protein ACLESO_08570 [Pyxidicoccus sp. 3LG]